LSSSPENWCRCGSPENSQYAFWQPAYLKSRGKADEVITALTAQHLHRTNFARPSEQNDRTTADAATEDAQAAAASVLSEDSG